MERTRFRLVGLIEWLVAAACVIAALVTAAVVSGEFAHVRPLVRVIAAAAAAPVVPAHVRPGSVSVPELLLPDGKRFQVHDPVSVLSGLPAQAQDGPTTVEHLTDGAREVRSYRYGGVEFVVVTANDEIVAIYR